MDFNGQDHDMDVKFATDSIGVQLWMRGYRRHGPVSFLTGYVSTNGHKTWHQSEGIVPCWIYCAFVQTRRWPYWTWNRPIGTWKDCRPRPPSYPEIKQYILNKYKIKVPSLYIAQVKRKLGLNLRECYNKPWSVKSRPAPQVGPEKEAAIVDALRYFNVIG